MEKYSKIQAIKDSIELLKNKGGFYNHPTVLHAKREAIAKLEKLLENVYFVPFGFDAMVAVSVLKKTLQFLDAGDDVTMKKIMSVIISIDSTLDQD